VRERGERRDGKEKQDEMRQQQTNKRQDKIENGEGA
jgi:hypothetical protein